MVCTLCSGLNVIRGVAPAAIVTAIVSPTALEIARMNAAIIPLKAAGRTTFITTSNFVAPKENAPALNDRGTDLIASSLMDATVGIIIMANTIDALSALKKFTFNPNQVSNTLSTKGVIKLIAKYPKTTEGIPASISMAGFKTLLSFSDAYSDISDASRPIKDSEKELCAENNIEWTEFHVAMDGLTVMVNPDNDWVTELTPEQIGQILGINSTIQKWSDVDPSWPDETISFFIPDPDSGTRDYMIEVVEDFVGDEDLRQDENTTFSSDDNVLLDGIANELYSFGFFGYAYYINNTDKVKAVAIVNEAGEAVLPSDASVQDGSYNPLARPLFIYANNESIASKPQVAEFLKFYLSEAGAAAIMADVGYSMPPDGIYDALNASLSAILGE